STDSAKYEVVSGERRLRAAKIAGLKKVPCIIIKDDLLAEEISLIENIQRQDLHPIELGEAFLNILESRQSLTQLELSKKLGISNKIISEYVNFAKLPLKVKDLVLKENITNRDVLRKIIKHPDPLMYLKNQNIKNTSKTTMRKSILRINLVDNELHLQANSVSLLCDSNKQKLRKIFEDLLTKI
nr:ParB/RepB/Spo0J family partition protein [Parachlamydiaceae bacterium]